MADVKVVLTATDNISGPLKKIGAAADGLGKELQQAGQQGAKGLNQIDKEADEAARSVDKVGDAGKKAGASLDDFGVALTAIGAGLAYAGDAALDQQQTIIGLQAAYGDAADEYIRFADELASRSIFNDDDILRGERYFATLRNNFDLTDAQIQQLMQTTADLASAYGTSFEDASSRITSAIRGEGEAAEFLGLTMNQQAIDRDNLTLSMSNQEAAQFRLNALYEQTGVYAGTAQKLAESEVGTRAKLTNAIQDNAQAIGNYIGPLGTMVAGMGFAVTGITGMTGSLSRMVTTARNSQRAMSALSLATSPLALGLTAVAVAGVVLWKDFQDGAKAAETLHDALRELDQAQQDLLISGNEQASAWIAGFRSDIQFVEGMAKARKDWMFDQGTDWWWEQAEKAGTSPGKLMQDMREQYSQTSEEAERFTAAVDRLSGAFADQNIDGAALNDELTRLYDAFGRGDLTWDQYSQAVIEVSDNLARFRKDIDNTTAAMQAHAAATRVMSAAYEGLADVQTDAANAGERIARSLDEQAAAAAAAVRDMDALTDAFGEMGSADKLDALPPKLDGLKDASREAFGQLVEDVRAANEAFATAFLSVTGDTDFASQLNLTQLATDASVLAENLSDAAAALDNVQRVIIGNTDAIANQLSGLNDWATELIGDPGTWAEIDNLVTEGRLSTEKWTAAQEAQIEIAGANAQVQRDVLAIQAAQAPILAGAAESTAAYVEQIRQLNDGYMDAADGAQQQLAALGWMDTAMQGQVQQVLEMATMLGDLGPAGAAAFDSMIAGIVATDPVMTAMLENLQLIDNVVRDQDGKVISYDVNLDGVDGAMSDIDQLKLSVNALIETLGGEVPALSLDVEGEEQIDDAKAKIDGLDDKRVGISFDLPDGSFQDLMDEAGLTGQDPVKVRAELDFAGADPSGALRGDGTGGPAVTVPVEADTAPAEQQIGAIGKDAPPVRVPVELDLSGLGGNAVSSAGDLARSALGNVQQSVQVEVTAIDNASPVIGEVITFAGSVDGYTASVDITATDNASAVVGDAVSFLSSVDGYTSTLTVAATDNASAVIGDAVSFASSVDGYTTTLMAAGVDNASAVIGGAVSFLSSVDGYSSTVYLNAVDNASPAIGNAISLLSSIDGYTATTYINTVSTATKGNRHGGIPGLATGGILFEGGEAGPELLHLATGGTVPLPSHAYYIAPPNSYVSPNNAAAGTMGGGLSIGPLYITVEGSVTSENNLAHAVADKIAPAIADAVSQRRAGMGV